LTSGVFLPILYTYMSLKTTFLGIQCKNPITTGAGTFGYGKELADFIDVSRLGAIVVKGTSLNAWPGNKTPRIFETPSGMLNSIGLQNEGLEYFIQNKMPMLRKLNTAIIVGIFDKTPENYAEIAEALDTIKGISALELNLSCPNVEAGGRTFCHDANLMREVITAVRPKTKLPIIAKLSPNVTDVVEIARAAIDAGADGLTLINTVLGMMIDTKKRKPQLNTNVGGLSGPAILPIALANVWKVRRALPRVPIIGVGGVHSTDTALQMILAGANLVGLGTANFYNPRICIEVIEGLEGYCKENKIKDISKLVGTVQDF